MLNMLLAADPVISSGDLTPVLESVTANISVILPVGIGLFAIILGIRMIPKIFSWFTS